MSIVLAVSAALSMFVPRIDVDRTLKSTLDISSPEFQQYENFLGIFGNEQFVVLAITNKDEACNSVVLEALESITKEIGELPKVAEVYSVCNLRFFQQRNQSFGNFPLVRKQAGPPIVPEKSYLDRVRKAIPLLDFLISKDMKTVGLIFTIKDEFLFYPLAIRQILEEVNAITRKHLPTDSQFHIIGLPVLRQAIERYNLQTAFTFTLACSLILTLVSVYVFKSVRVAVITSVVIALCILWVMVLMSLFGIRLSSATSISFGIVIVISVATVIHMVNHYNQCFQVVRHRIEAIEQALVVVGRPVLMCAVTTSVGFASLMVSSVPVVRQFGLIMSVGVLVSFILAMCLVPAFLTIMKPIDPRKYDRMSRDLVGLAYNGIRDLTFNHFKACSVMGIVITGLMIAGVPRIRSDMQLLSMFSSSTREAKDIAFVQARLNPIRSVEVLVKGRKKAFTRTEAWAKVRLLESRLREIEGVASTESLLPLLEYLNEVVADQRKPANDICDNPALLSEALGLISLSGQGGLRGHYMDRTCSRIRISVRLRNSSSKTTAEMVDQIRKVAVSVMDDTAQVTVTGYPVLFAGLSAKFARAQVLSLGLALLIITVLMMIQFRSVMLGLLSLIPNILPLTVIFGTMGWLRINLDAVTVFAAAVSIGLSVDGTIHYVTQFERLMRTRQAGRNMRQSLLDAYHTTARAVISNSIVLSLGFLMLVMSPFLSIVHFGFLCALALVAALVGDLMLMPAAILSFSPIKNLVSRETQR